MKPQSPFFQISVLETEKRELREAIRAIAADIQPSLSVDAIATRLFDMAVDHSFSMRGRTGGGWGDTANEALRRLRDGRLRTDDDLLRAIANRHLASNTQPSRD